MGSRNRSGFKKSTRGVPELITPAPWVISEGDGATSIVSGVFSVPLGDSVKDAQVRAHELAHIRWSPKDPKRTIERHSKREGITPDSIAVMEDCRINLRLRKAGINVDRLYKEGYVNDVSERVSGDPRKVAIATALAMTSRPLLYDERECAIEKLGQERFSLLCKIIYNIEARSGRFTSTVSAAKAFDALFPPFVSGDDTTEKLRKILAEAMIERDMRPGQEAEDAEWGELRIVRFPLKVPHRGALAALRVRPAEVGPMRFPWRIPPYGDGAIFANRSRNVGESVVLVDVSGSMELSDSDVMRIVEAAPGSLVALYSGDHSKTFGTVRIVADRGRMAEPEQILDQFRFGKLNIIDGPALRWAVSQRRGKVIWVSDGKVTGLGELFSPALIQECVRIVQESGIIHVETVDEAVDVLENMRKR